MPWSKGVAYRWGVVPLVVAHHRHDAAVAGEPGAEHSIGRSGLQPGVDRPGAGFVRPSRAQSPTGVVDLACGDVLVVPLAHDPGVSAWGDGERPCPVVGSPGSRVECPHEGVDLDVIRVSAAHLREVGESAPEPRCRCIKATCSLKDWSLDGLLRFRLCAGSRFGSGVVLNRALVFIRWAALRGASQRRFILEARRSFADLARAILRRGRRATAPSTGPLRTEGPAGQR